MGEGLSLVYLTGRTLGKTLLILGKKPMSLIIG